jgi:hypothetical protein
LRRGVVDISISAPAPASGVVLPIDARVLAAGLATCDDHAKRARVFANARTTICAFLSAGGHDTDTVVACSELYLWLKDMQSREARQIKDITTAYALELIA